MRCLLRQPATSNALWLALALVTGLSGIFAAKAARAEQRSAPAERVSRERAAPVRTAEPGEHPSPSTVTELVGPLSTRATGTSRRVDLGPAGLVSQVTLQVRFSVRGARALFVERRGDRPQLSTCSSQGPPAPA